MQVTILSNSKGGVFAVTMQWAKGLIRKGCDVNIFFLLHSRETKNLTPSKHMHFNYFTGPFFIPNLRTFIAFLVYDHPNIVHTNFAWLGPLAIFKKWIFKTHFIYTIHGLPQPWLESSLLYKIAYTIEHSLLHFVASQSSVVVAVSYYVKEMLKKQYSIESEVIYHGIDADRFRPMHKAGNKRMLQYEENDFLVLFVGKMHPAKDPLTLVRSIHEVIKENKNVHLAMIGDGELYQEVRDEVLKLDLSGNVKLLGQMNHVKLQLWYNAAELFVLTSISESFGMTLLEAMASGLPIIASNSTACPEVVGNAGLLFTQGDYNDLARKIVRLVSDDNLLRILRDRSLKRVRRVFSWNDKIDKYYELYRKTIGEAIHG